MEAAEPGAERLLIAVLSNSDASVRHEAAKELDQFDGLATARAPSRASCSIRPPPPRVLRNSGPKKPRHRFSRSSIMKRLRCGFQRGVACAIGFARAGPEGAL